MDKIPFKRPGRRRENKMELEGIRCKVVGWIRWSQDNVFKAIDFAYIF